MSPEEIVDGQLAAYNARDLDAFVSFFADDIPVLTFPSGEIMADRSGPAFRERFRAIFESSPGLKAELVSRVVQGRIVVDQELITGSLGGETRRAVALYEVGETKIERMWFVA